MVFLFIIRWITSFIKFFDSQVLIEIVLIRKLYPILRINILGLFAYEINGKYL